MRSTRLLCASFTAFTASSFAADRPNIIWIFTEDLSPLMGCYGDPMAQTPFLDSLARHAVVYNKMYTIAPISAPSRSCLVTGMYPGTLGTPHLRQDQIIPDDLQLVPQALSKAGYWTSLRHKTDFNFKPQGSFDDLSSDGSDLWRKRKKGQPFFVYRNTGTTHEGSGNSDNHYRAIVKVPKERLCDPDNVILPPYYPNTPEMRRIYAGYYNLAASFDLDVQEVFAQLKADNLLDNTIVFIFSDHGTGLPRYKRWCNVSGTHIPLMVYLPPKYRHLSPNQPGEFNGQVLSSIDLPATVLHLAGAKAPSTVVGQPFLGKNIPAAREYAFIARDRADDMYECSRGVISNRYCYVRHYMPYMPPMPTGDIFSPGKKWSSAELHRVYSEGKDPSVNHFFTRKPNEELYDLAVDPLETRNLANDPAYSKIKSELRSVLHRHLLEMRDVSLLPEPEMMARSEGTTSYQVGQASSYALSLILDAAEKVGTASWEEFASGLKSPEAGVRYWSIIGLLNLETNAQPALSALLPLLHDPSPACQMTAAEAIALLGRPMDALPVLVKWLKHDKVYNQLYAARALEQIAPFSQPVLTDMEQVLDQITVSCDAKGVRKFKDSNLYSFTGWALESAIKKCTTDGGGRR